MRDLRDEEVRQAVRKAYADIAETGSAGYCGGLSWCCGETAMSSTPDASVKIGEVELVLQQTGFVEIRVKANETSREVIREGAQGKPLADFIVSATSEAIKP